MKDRKVIDYKLKHGADHLQKGAKAVKAIRGSEEEGWSEDDKEELETAKSELRQAQADIAEALTDVCEALDNCIGS